MIEPQQNQDSAAFDLFGTVLAVLIVMLSAWIFGQVFARPVLAAVRWLISLTRGLLA